MIQLVIYLLSRIPMTYLTRARCLVMTVLVSLKHILTIHKLMATSEFWPQPHSCATTNSHIWSPFGLPPTSLRGLTNPDLVELSSSSTPETDLRDSKVGQSDIKCLLLWYTLQPGRVLASRSNHQLTGNMRAKGASDQAKPERRHCIG